MTTDITGQAAAFVDDFNENVSPPVDHSIPRAQRRVDLETRNRNIRSLCVFHEDYLAGEGKMLSATSRRQLESACAILEKVTQASVVEDLQDFQVMMVLDFLAERGFSKAFQYTTMRRISDMLSTTLIQTHEYDE